MAGSNNSYSLNKGMVDSCTDRLRISFLKQLDDFLIQGCFFFGNSFIRSHVDTSLNIIDSSFNCGSHEEIED